MIECRLQNLHLNLNLNLNLQINFFFQEKDLNLVDGLILQVVQAQNELFLRKELMLIDNVEQ